MPEVFTLDVQLYGTSVGTLTRIEGDRTIFAFNEAYAADPSRSVLSLGFKDAFGELITDFRPYQTALMPFFSNLLPEGDLRRYLAERGGINEKREFFLLWLLGTDLPGAVTVVSTDGVSLPPSPETDDEQDDERQTRALRFSLAGVQLKFSAAANAAGGLAVPAHGVGGSWIVKLPSPKYPYVPENEYSMLTLARLLGIDVPAIELVDLRDIGSLPSGLDRLRGRHALAIERFDRLSDGTRVHIEDFAQVFGIYPAQKYDQASAVNIAKVIAAESDIDDIAEFVRRLTFNVLIGNADMHVKNWSVIYADRRTARLAPAYDFVSTIPYIPDDKAALKFSRTRRFDEFSFDELSHLAARAGLPESLVLETARETASKFLDLWPKERDNLPLHRDVIEAIDRHLQHIPVAREA